MRPFYTIRSFTRGNLHASSAPVVGCGRNDSRVLGLRCQRPTLLGENFEIVNLFFSGSTGPSVELLNPLIEKAIPVLLQLLQKDENVAVRDTAAWTIGRVCHVSRVQVSKNLEGLVAALLNCLKDEPQVAKNACWALHNLAGTFEDEVDSQVGSLSNYVELIIAGLLETTTRQDAEDYFSLRSSAYEALSRVIQYLPQVH